MLSKISSVLSVLLLMSCAEKPQLCTVTGNIEDLKGTNNIHVLKQVSEFGRDTIISSTSTDGKFSVAIPADKLGYMYEINIEGHRGNIGFFAENGNVTINGTSKQLYFSIAFGTYENDRLKSYNTFIKEISNGRNEVMKNNVNFSQDEIREMMKAFDNKMNAFKDSLIFSDSSSIYSLYLVKSRLALMDHNQIDEYLSTFSEKLKQHEYYKEMLDRADVLRKVAPGAIAPNFTAQRPDGTAISLSDFHGQYVLLDFWASWCAPCRIENVHAKEMHEEFAKKGLKILSFSLDSDKTKWIEAIEKDGLTWDNASDLIGGKNSPVAASYGIDGIPAIWLIGPDGKIIAEGLRGEKLSALCREIFN